MKLKGALNWRNWGSISIIGLFVIVGAALPELIGVDKTLVIMGLIIVIGGPVFIINKVIKKEKK